MKKEILGYFGLILTLLFFAFPVLALEVDWPSSPLGTTLTDDSNLTDFIQYFYEWGLFIGGGVTLLALIIGGILYLTSVGNPAKMKEAKDRIFTALTGLVLLFSIYLILNTINPDLTSLTLPSFEPTDVESFEAEELIKEAGKSCEFVDLYEDTYWEGCKKRIGAEEDPPLQDIRGCPSGLGCKCETAGGDFVPKSVKFFQRCAEGETCEDGKIYIKK
mgnify:CR=1 FL=1